MSMDITIGTSFRRILAPLVLAAALASAGAANAQSSLAPIRIGTASSDLGAQVYYADDLGFFRNAGLQATISPISGGPTIMAAVASGDLDIGWGNAIDATVAHQRGIPITIIATATIEDQSDPGTGILAVTNASGLKSAKDLDGKTIALLSLRNFTELATRNWVDKNGGDAKTVHFVEMPYSEMPAALQAGRIDAAVLDNTADPTLGKPGDPLHVLSAVFFTVAPRLEGAVWYSTTTWVAAHRQQAKAFVAVMKQTALWANAHHDDSATILAAHISRTVDQIRGSKRVIYGTDISPALVQPELDLAFKYGLLSQPVQALEMITNP
ncbi:MAG: ABC transporter substrate-binding protein [Candidatus Lustribacter sp.]|jgi:NitT/TauT family transport system substrate-binding protein